MFDEEQEQEDGEMCKCASCGIEVLCDELEAHICSEHLDYFPYSCGFCSHFFTTDVLAHFHAKTKKHLPMKIRDQPDIRKYSKLHRMIERSLEGLQGNREQMSQFKNPLLSPDSSRTSRQLDGQSFGRIAADRKSILSLEDHEDNESVFNAKAVLEGEQLDAAILQGKIPNGDCQEKVEKKTTLKTMKRVSKGGKGKSFDSKFSQVATLSNGKVYRFMQCRVCGAEVCEAEISTHIFQVHVEWENMVKCSYCDFQHTHDYTLVKKHLLEVHPGQKVVIRDRRKGSKAQLLLKKWCKSCFTGKVETVLGKRAASCSSKKNEHKKKMKKQKSLKHQALGQEEEGRPEDVFESAFIPITAPVEVAQCSDKSICQKCGQVVPKSKVDEHVWLEHNGGELPYNCGKCNKSTITLDDMETHWSMDHCTIRVPYSATASCSTMEVIPNPSSRPKFDIQMVECFPKEAGDRWAKIKIEPEDDYY